MDNEALPAVDPASEQHQEFWNRMRVLDCAITVHGNEEATVNKADHILQTAQKFINFLNTKETV